MDDMAATDLALSTMRVRQSVVSSFCAWLVKREVLAANPEQQGEDCPPKPPNARRRPGTAGAPIDNALRPGGLEGPLQRPLVV